DGDGSRFLDKPIAPHCLMHSPRIMGVEDRGIPSTAIGVAPPHAEQVQPPLSAKHIQIIGQPRQ
ncbi:22616_t:CDS:1, partial [Racocetra persica]